MVAIDAALKQKLKSDEYAHRSYTFTMYDADGAVELQFSNDKIVEQKCNVQRQCMRRKHVGVWTV